MSLSGSSASGSSGSSPRTTPSPVPLCRSDSDQRDWDGLSLNLTAREMRERIGSKKKSDPRREKLDMRKKFEIIQTLWWKKTAIVQCAKKQRCVHCQDFLVIFIQLWWQICWRHGANSTAGNLNWVEILSFGILSYFVHLATTILKCFTVQLCEQFSLKLLFWWWAFS